MFRTIRLPLLAVAFAAIFAACSANAGGPSVASLDDPGASSSPAASSAPTDPQEAFLAYAECMRDNGIDMPDPEIVEGTGEAKGGVAFRVGVDGEGGDAPGKEEFRAADSACRHHLANVITDRANGGMSPEDEEKLLAFTRCMREHGIDMPDPQSNGMVFSEEEGTGPEFDPNSDEFQEAQEACGDLLPGKIQVSGSGPGEGGAGPKTTTDGDGSR